jgi:excinuclease ABC subunit C
MRQGQVLDKFNYLLDRPLGQTEEETWETILAQHYTLASEHPKEIIIARKPLTLWQTIVQPAKLITATRGNKKKLLELATANAYGYYQRIKQQAEIPVALYQLQEELQLKELPFRIECYDISNIQGNFSVAAMVVFEGGKKKPSQYKKFKIKTVTGLNDFASLAEVLTRRQNHPEWGEPNLIIIDGGKGQLSSVMKVIKPEWKSRVIALAKREEEIFIPGKMGSLKLPKSHPVSLLVQAIRNETHRFGITFYRQRHKRSFRSS